MRHLRTTISLPPGVPPRSRVQELLRTIFEQYRWFRPERYGIGILKEKIDPNRIDYDALLAFFEQFASIDIGARTDRDHILLGFTRPGDPPHVGELLWMTSDKEALKPTWRITHARQVVDIMRVMRSPVAQSGLDDDYERKKWRLVPAPDGLSAVETFNVRDPSEGLVGLVWRNFFGPPFVELFGERLATLPAEFKQDLGDGVVLVQPYELPTQAGTPEALERERQLIAHLGPECFYDHEHHQKPSRVPRLPAPPG